MVHAPTKIAALFETLEAKKAFEAYCSLYGHMVCYYHCDNGHFADNAFLPDVSAKNQSISFCSMNAHFQNVMAEKTIHDLRDQTRKLILHACPCKVGTSNTYIAWAICTEGCMPHEQHSSG